MAEPHFDGTVDKSVQNHECKVYTIYRTWYSTQYNIWLLSVPFTENLNWQSKFPPKLNCGPDGNFALLET